MANINQRAAFAADSKKNTGKKATVKKATKKKPAKGRSKGKY